ncbi:MAG: Crp/Fnr family transcriptional regulator [Pseudomonadota bacterium]|nr:Crp/Fnr family transcriptional regulator [Pseudomonadota bacterium]
MSAGSKKILNKQFLFREGDASDSAYVVKSGKIIITKSKGNSEIILAELGPGSMLGEMAFFDNKPRSAGARAHGDAEVIALPFVALNAQFKKFPEWLKVMVKTINQHLREANQRIKNLENTTTHEKEVFDAHTITRYLAILHLIGTKYGEPDPEGVIVPSGVLRKYTIQIFQQPTAKMQRLIEALQELGYAIIQDLGEGRQRVIIKNLNMLGNLTDFYNDYLFVEEKKRVTIEERELLILRALIQLAKQSPIDDKGFSTVSLTKMQNESMATFGQVIRLEEANPLIEKGLLNEKMQSNNGEILTKLKVADLETIYPYWQIIYSLKKIKK